MGLEIKFWGTFCRWITQGGTGTSSDPSREGKRLGKQIERIYDGWPVEVIQAEAEARLQTAATAARVAIALLRILGKREGDIGDDIGHAMGLIVLRLNALQVEMGKPRMEPPSLV